MCFLLVARWFSRSDKPPLEGFTRVWILLPFSQLRVYTPAPEFGGLPVLPTRLWVTGRLYAIEGNRHNNHRSAFRFAQRRTKPSSTLASCSRERSAAIPAGEC